MKLIVFYGSPRKGNTFAATAIVLDALRSFGELDCTEYHLPAAMPEFCTGCQACLSSPREHCPHAKYVDPILADILAADALLFASPHYGASDMSAAMKNLLDHLDFLALNVAPRSELFKKRALVLTTGAGSTSAAGPLKRGLLGWGLNRVNVASCRMLTDKWINMPIIRQKQVARGLRRAAKWLYFTGPRRPLLPTRMRYHLAKFVLQRFVGEGAYPYEYWKGHGFFDRCPL